MMTGTDDSPIKKWTLEERPREKLEERGISAMVDVELLAILLASGTREKSAVGLARELLQSFYGIKGIARASVQDLMATPGIGKAKATAIVAAFELGRRRQSVQPEGYRITSSADAAKLFMPQIGDESKEHFMVVFLNRNNVVISQKKVSVGGVSATIIDPKIVFKEALVRLSTAIIVAHNHPSGNLNPSMADRKITQRLKEGGKLLDITLLDHLIITDEGYWSFSDNGEI